MKHLLRYILVFILTLGAAGTYVCSAGENAPLSGMISLAAAAPAEEKVTMEAAVGYGGAAKTQHYLPVRVDLSNGTGQVFEGQLDIQVLESNFEVYRYSYPISVKPESGQQEIYYIPLGVRSEQLNVTLEDADGKSVISKRLRLNVVENMSELYIGVLSDHPEELMYLDDVITYNNMIQTRVLPMNAANFPEDVIGLDMMDVVLVNDYRINSLNNAQTEALLRWVADGGTLVFGTGENIRDNLGSLGSRFFPMPYPEAVSTQVDMGAEYAADTPGDAIVTLPCVTIDLENGSEIMSSDEMVLMTRVAEGRGSIVLAAYDFADIAGFCEQFPSYVGKIMDAVFTSAQLDRIAQNAFSGFSDQYWSAQNMVSSGNVERLPNLTLYAIVIIAYVILAGPALYVFLKHRDLQKHYVISVLTASLLAATVIYFMSAGTRFKDRFFSYVSIQEVSGDQSQDTTFVSVQAPFNNPYSVAFDPGYTVRPVTRSRLYEMEVLPRIGEKDDYQVDIHEGLEETRVSVEDGVSFESYLFKLTKMERAAGEPGAEVELAFDGGDLTGTVTNTSGKEMQDATLLLYGKFVRLGDLEPGETVHVETLESVAYPLSYSYAAAQMATGFDRYEKADITNKDYMTDQRRANLMNFYIGQVFKGYNSGVWLVWFTGEEEEPDRFLAGEGYENDGITIYSMELDVKHEADGIITRSAHRRLPQVVSGAYFTQYNSMQGVDPLVLEYSLGTDIRVEKLILEYVSDSFRDAEEYPYLTIFEGTMLFYNYNTGEYDAMDTEKTEFDREELLPYLSPDNKLRVRYVQENSGNISWDVVLPLLSVTGRER